MNLLSIIELISRTNMSQSNKIKNCKSEQENKLNEIHKRVIKYMIFEFSMHCKLK